MNAEFMQNLMVQQSEMMKKLVVEFQGVQGKKAEGGGSYQDERRFRDMKVFGGKEDQYKERSMKLKAKIEEYNLEMHEAVVKAEEGAGGDRSGLDGRR